MGFEGVEGIAGGGFPDEEAAVAIAGGEGSSTRAVEPDGTRSWASSMALREEVRSVISAPMFLGGSESQTVDGRWAGLDHRRALEPAAGEPEGHHDAGDDADLERIHGC